MTTQIAVRLADDLVAFVDQEAAGGSRAAVVSAALSELRRHRLAERDAEILRRTGDYEDFDGLAGAAALDDLA